MAGGASIIDVKEPRLGSLGRADASIWREVRNAVPDAIPVSVALGELNEWSTLAREVIPKSAWSGIAFRKLGLSAAGAEWQQRWGELRREFDSNFGKNPTWIAVVYADWERAQSPPPDSVIDVAMQIGECGGVLIDTWDKSRRTPMDLSWKRLIDRIQGSERLVALAGSLDAEEIARLGSLLNLDVFAVRGAACEDGDRLAPLDGDRVAKLAQAVRALPSSQ